MKFFVTHLVKENEDGEVEFDPRFESFLHENPEMEFTMEYDGGLYDYNHADWQSPYLPLVAILDIAEEKYAVLFRLTCPQDHRQSYFQSYFY